MAEKHNLNAMLRAVDLKDRDYWDNCSEEQRKSYSSFLALRYASSVNATGPMADVIESYYIQNANEAANPHLFSLGKAHAKLQWLLISAISPGTNVYKHEWFGFKNKGSKSKTVNLLLTIYPTMKLTDAELLDQCMTKEDYKTLLIEQGWTDEAIKKAFKGKDNDD